MIDETREEEYEEKQEEITLIKIKIYLTFLISFFLFFYTDLMKITHIKFNFFSLLNLKNIF
jgi:hypothetical protein